jgi:hypothetical protein
MEAGLLLFLEEPAVTPAMRWQSRSVGLEWPLEKRWRYTMTASRVIGISAILLSAVILAACSSSPKSTPSNESTPAPVVKKEPVLLTGKSCLSQMASMAARWQTDALPFHFESEVNSESNGQGGQATIWRGMFASPSRGTYKQFVCSGSRLKESPPIGVTSGTEITSGPNVAAAMFERSYLITDSDKAYEITQRHGGDSLIKKNPQQPVVYVLVWDRKKQQLLWVVTYGTTANSKDTGVIDASTGKFLRAAM